MLRVLEYIRGPVSEPLSSKPLRIITIKTFFLLSLATAKLVGKIQALSCRVAFQGSDISLTYLPAFVTKMESEKNSPSSFLPRQAPVGICWGSYRGTPFVSC